jgi:heptosyltransferase-1
MSRRILVVRLGAMGDIIHTLPAVAALKRGNPDVDIDWAVEPRWIPLLEGNPDVSALIRIDRSQLALSWHRLRERHYDAAVDFQGLIKSALVARASRAEVVYGFDSSAVRERSAAIFYSRTILPRSAHVVDRNLELARAAGGAEMTPVFEVPAGRPEGSLPDGPFVLANPFAGWGGKQWPLDSYAALARKLAEAGYALVLNAAQPFDACESHLHVSGLAGLVDATRRAAAVVGLDSGPLHLAAALGKPGVAIFGPTSPDRNGPYGGRIRVLRAPDAITTYKRNADVHDSMRAVTPEQVWAALEPQLPR